jgi:hypothetical protein
MLNLKSFITPSALLAAFTLAGSPAFAQERYHGRQNPSGEASSGRAAERAQPRSDGQNSQAGAAPRAERRREAPAAQQAPPQQQQEAPRVQPAQPQPRQEAPRVQSAQPRQADQPRADNRGNESRGTDNRGTDNRRVEGRAVPRDNNVYANRDNNVYANRDNNVYRNRDNDVYRNRDNVYTNRGNVYAPHNSPRYSSHYTPRGYGYYGSRSYYRPYVFRPRFSIGFGIYAGYPVPYTYSYPYPIEVYGYRAPRERVIVSPGSPYYGGIALEMTPYDADVFVDGEYAGRVEDFDGATQPLTLTAGMHEIEVQAPGYEPMRMNVEIHAGQVIPYRGDLRPY